MSGVIKDSTASLETELAQSTQVKLGWGASPKDPPVSISAVQAFGTTILSIFTGDQIHVFLLVWQAGYELSSLSNPSRSF